MVTTEHERIDQEQHHVEYAEATVFNNRLKSHKNYHVNDIEQIDFPAIKDGHAASV